MTAGSHASSAVAASAARRFHWDRNSSHSQVSPFNATPLAQVCQQPIALLKQPLDGRSISDGKPLRADAVLHAPIPLNQHRLHRRAQRRLFRRRATQRVASHGDRHRQQDAGRGHAKVAPSHDDLAGLGNRSYAQRCSTVGLLPLDLQCQRRLGFGCRCERAYGEQQARQPSGAKPCGASTEIAAGSMGESSIHWRFLRSQHWSRPSRRRRSSILARTF